jgi:hypothetical protein
VPDFGDEARNRQFDEAVSDFIRRISALMLEGERPLE